MHRENMCVGWSNVYAFNQFCYKENDTILFDDPICNSREQQICLNCISIQIYLYWMQCNAMRCICCGHVAAIFQFVQSICSTFLIFISVGIRCNWTITNQIIHCTETYVHLWNKLRLLWIPRIEQIKIYLLNIIFRFDYDKNALIYWK